MSAHTPGPWLTERNQQGGIAVVGVNDVTGINEINVANAWYDGDARLIAAAPDMADALWNLLVALGQHTADMTPAQLADICPACDAATAALIKSGRVLG